MLYAPAMGRRDSGRRRRTRGRHRNVADAHRALKPLTVKDNNPTGRRLAELEENDIQSFRDLQKRRDEIQAGDLPALEEILIHAVWCKDSMVTDRHHFFTSIRRKLELADSEAAIIDQCIVDGSAPLLMLAREIFDQRGRYSDVARCDLYIACSDDLDAAEEAAKRLYHERQTGRFDKRFGEALRRATTLGLLHTRFGHRESDIDAAQRYGIQQLLNLGRDIDAHRQADLWLASNPDAAEAIEKGLFAKLIADSDMADAMAEVNEDRSEVDRRDRDAGVVVVPKFTAPVSGFRKEVRKEFEKVAGERLPLIDRGPVDLHFRTLAARWPHARDVIETILGDLAAREHVRFRPTCLVGEPGSGKTALARAIAMQLSLPVEVYGMAGASDSSAMGTSAQWHSARPSVPLQLIQRSGYANGLVIWDEIEKASPDRRNGNAIEALLPLLEPSQARAVRDLSIEVEVDLSWISHFATANSLDGIPDPIRDRMRIIKMPDPGWQHIGDLAPQIIRDIARDRGVDERWYPPLAPDELDVIRKAWPGGSLRKLRAAIEATLGARDAFIGRA